MRRRPRHAARRLLGRLLRALARARSRASGWASARTSPALRRTRSGDLTLGARGRARGARSASRERAIDALVPLARMLPALAGGAR